MPEVPRPRRPRVLLALLAVPLLVAGCRTTKPRGTGAPPPPPAAGTLPAPIEEGGAPTGSTGARGDVILDGVSILGAWTAVEVAGDARATRDLASGRVQQTLVVGSNGRAVLTSVDRRAGGDPVAQAGRITGNRVQLDGASGPGTLIMSGRRLLLRTADGRSTVFARGGG